MRLWLTIFTRYDLVGSSVALRSNLNWWWFVGLRCSHINFWWCPLSSRTAVDTLSFLIFAKLNLIFCLDFSLNSLDFLFDSSFPQSHLRKRSIDHEQVFILSWERIWYLHTPCYLLPSIIWSLRLKILRSRSSVGN